jgi:hypothetical protein
MWSHSLAAVAGRWNQINSAPPRLANGDTDQVNQFAILKLADTLHEVGELRPPSRTRCSGTFQGGWSVEKGELCLGAG